MISRNIGAAPVTPVIPRIAEVSGFPTQTPMVHSGVKTDRPIVSIVRACSGLTCDWKIKAQIRVQSECRCSSMVIAEHICQEISRTFVKDPMTGCKDLVNSP